MSTKPVKITFVADESDLAKSLAKAGGDLDGFAADAKTAGAKAETALAGVGDKADAVGGASSQAAGGIGDLGGALSLMPGPLGAVGAGMEAAAPAIMGVTGAADLLNLATTKFPALAKAQTIATNVMAGAQKALNAVMAGNPIALVVLAIVSLIAIFTVLYAKNETFRELVQKVFGTLKVLVEMAVEKMGQFLSAAREKLQGAGEKFAILRQAAADAIGSYSDGGGGVLGRLFGIVTAISGLPGTIANKAAGIFGPVREAAANAVGSYSGGGGGALGKLHDIVSTITGLGGEIANKASGMWDGIGNSFKGVINKIIGWWNDLSFTLDIPNALPGLPNSFTISTPDIRPFATGGIVMRPTLGLVGEAGPEAVIPLSKFDGLMGGNTVVYVNVQATPGTDRVALAREIQTTLDIGRRAGVRPGA